MRTTFPTTTRKALAAAALVAAASLSAAAGGGEDGAANASPPATKPSAPKPVASIDSLTGNTTEVALDQGFVDALTQLKLTPGTVGTAKLANGSLIFPITGGNVTVFKPG